MGFWFWYQEIFCFLLGKCWALGLSSSPLAWDKQGLATSSSQSVFYKTEPRFTGLGHDKFGWLKEKTAITMNPSAELCWSKTRICVFIMPRRGNRITGQFWSKTFLVGLLIRSILRGKNYTSALVLGQFFQRKIEGINRPTRHVLR